jgi:hypothetical protein
MYYIGRSRSIFSYQLELEVAHHFVFPEIGTAIAKCGLMTYCFSTLSITIAWHKKMPIIMAKMSTPPLFI